MFLHHVGKLARNFCFSKTITLYELKTEEGLMKSFIEARFGYCHLIWMFHTRELKN